MMAPSFCMVYIHTCMYVCTYMRGIILNVYVYTCKQGGMSSRYYILSVSV